MGCSAQPQSPAHATTANRRRHNPHPTTTQCRPITWFAEHIYPALFALPAPQAEPAVAVSPAAVRAAATTNVETAPCADHPKHLDHCPSWKTQGECANNPLFMLWACPKSCGKCGTGTDWSAGAAAQAVEQPQAVQPPQTAAATKAVAVVDTSVNPADADPAIAGSTWPAPDPYMLARRRLDPNDPFPPRVAPDLCEARGGQGRDQNKIVLDNMRVEPDNADGHTLFCMVYTIAKQHEKAGVVVRDSWASRCDGFVVMSDKEDPSLPAARVTHEGKEEYNNIWQKVRSIWKYVHLHYGDKFDWFHIGGDDLLVIPPNMRAYLLSEEIQRESNNGGSFYAPNSHHHHHPLPLTTAAHCDSPLPPTATCPSLPNFYTLPCRRQAHVPRSAVPDPQRAAVQLGRCWLHA